MSKEILIKIIREEIEKFNQGGVLLIYGKPLEDGTRRLYITNIKQLSQHNRLKKDNTDAVPNRNATIGKPDEVYRIALEDGKLKAKGVSWTSNDSMKNVLGLSSNNVGLHYNKTPLHERTLYYNSIPKVLNELEGFITALSDVKWNG